MLLIDGDCHMYSTGARRAPTVGHAVAGSSQPLDQGHTAGFRQDCGSLVGAPTTLTPSTTAPPFG